MVNLLNNMSKENEEEPASEVSEDNHDPHFEPIISLPEVIVPTLEEEESVLIQLRAKLFRMDTVDKEWKERGTGDAKLLHNEGNKTVRMVMRRDKTLKLCANHYVTKEMELKPSIGSDRSFVWSTLADFADGESRNEILAIRFVNSENAQKWKTAFENAKNLIEAAEDEEEVLKEIKDLKLDEEEKEDTEKEKIEEKSGDAKEDPVIEKGEKENVCGS